ncbi:hypothetical protein EV421DRAFT_2023654 [Armillaria borealis]|uniref:Uncharacterized protein n=1 Tax=Armillaria borealis TaxID=47425 RepID=A0AA39MGP7_9AGAR|nr:hypothetical protein EV421DRAFT_2023654 [Armillaria borealis]
MFIEDSRVFTPLVANSPDAARGTVKDVSVLDTHTCTAPFSLPTGKQNILQGRDRCTGGIVFMTARQDRLLFKLGEYGRSSIDWYKLILQDQLVTEYMHVENITFEFWRCCRLGKGPTWPRLSGGSEAVELQKRLLIVRDATPKLQSEEVTFCVEAIRHGLPKRLTNGPNWGRERIKLARTRTPSICGKEEQLGPPTARIREDLWPMQRDSIISTSSTYGKARLMVMESDQHPAGRLQEWAVVLTNGRTATSQNPVYPSLPNRFQTLSLTTRDNRSSPPVSQPPRIHVPPLSTVPCVKFPPFTAQRLYYSRHSRALPENQMQSN